MGTNAGTNMGMGMGVEYEYEYEGCTKEEGFVEKEDLVRRSPASPHVACCAVLGGKGGEME